MTTHYLCPKCAGPLPAEWPQGRPCPKCLLQVEAASSAAASGSSLSGSFSERYQPPQPEELAPYFPQLEVKEFLGQGGMGAVYKARQVKLDRLVALKVFPKAMGEDPAFAERFQREAKALARLHHPNIISVFDFGETHGLYFLVLEFVDGANLRNVLQAGKLSPQEALRIVPQICEALQYAHDEGVVHRDIKPENVMLDLKGRVKIADFGLAKIAGKTPGDERLTHSRQVMGTQGYMAPEQVEKPLAVDHRADIYALGVVFYEMLTGELPMGKFDPPSQKVGVDVRLDQVVLRALEKEPQRRYQKVSEIKTDVESITSRPIGPASPEGPGPWKKFGQDWGAYMRESFAPPKNPSEVMKETQAKRAAEHPAQKDRESLQQEAPSNGFFVWRMGGEEGPQSLDDLRGMVTLGIVHGNSWIRKARSGSWFRAREIPDLFSPRIWLVALLISCFFGVLGIDRLYLGNYFLAFLKFISLGGFGIWYIVDIILLVVGRMRDADGRYLAKPFG